MMKSTFQQKSVFDIVYGKDLGVTIDDSDPSESGGGFVYPWCTFHTTLNRRYGYRQAPTAPLLGQENVILHDNLPG